MRVDLLIDDCKRSLPFGLAVGAGKKCGRESCEKNDLGGGFCSAHGGGKRCDVDGCEKGGV